MPNDRIVLGHISAAHGVRGDVLVKTYTATPTDLLAYPELIGESGTFTIKQHRVTSKGIVLAFGEVNNRTQAEALKGSKLWVERADLPPTDDEDEFYIADLVGLHATLPDGTPFGLITAVQNYGADDLLEVKPTDGGKTELIPFTKANVPTVDITNRTVTVIPPSVLGEETRNY